jgi:hypothetical protein
VAFHDDTYNRYIQFVEKKLESLRVGTRVLTYHGFGGVFPQSYHRVLQESAGSDALELWVKQGSHRKR